MSSHETRVSYYKPKTKHECWISTSDFIYDALKSNKNNAILANIQILRWNLIGFPPVKQSENRYKAKKTRNKETDMELSEQTESDDGERP